MKKATRSVNRRKAGSPRPTAKPRLRSGGKPREVTTESPSGRAGVRAYNAAQSPGDRRICDSLCKAIDRHLKGAECKVWHAHPVWFLDGNPIVGYSRLKDCIRLLFWSGQSFDEPGLTAEGSFKAAEARYTSVDQIHARDLKRWLAKGAGIQWDYKNIVKRKGKLLRLK